MRPVLLILTGLLAGAFVMNSAPAPDQVQKAQTFKKVVSKTYELNYLQFLPKDYEAKPGQRWPLILFLHGAGERGANLWQVAVHGPPKIVKDKQDFPFIVISPQCPAHEAWSDETILALLDEITTKLAVDTNRIYLTGLSMGGFGSWSLGTKYPERFAAMAPICGGGEVLHILLGDLKNTSALKTLGVWAFHGGKDPVVPLNESERMVAALKKDGCTDVKLTVYPEAQHDSWSEAYQDPKLYEWFLQHQRQAKP